MARLGFKIRDVKFADNQRGVEVSYGELSNIGDKQYSCAFTYEDEQDYDDKIIMAKEDIMQKVNK